MSTEERKDQLLLQYETIVNMLEWINTELDKAEARFHQCKSDQEAQSIAVLMDNLERQLTHEEQNLIDLQKNIAAILSDATTQ